MEQEPLIKFENQYLTHSEYSELGGKILEMPFNLLEYRAEKKIDEMTSNRFRKLKQEEYPQELKMCVYELIDIFHSEGNSSIISESVGNYSKTKQSKENIDKTKENIITQYLSEYEIEGIKVLYRGADC